MNIEILYSDRFLKDIRKMIKKYSSIEKDINTLIFSLEKNPYLGTELGKGFYKIRIKNSDNNKGKSGGYRTITYYDKGDKLILITIYSKSEKENIYEKELNEILNNYNKK